MSHFQKPSERGEREAVRRHLCVDPPECRDEVQGAAKSPLFQTPTVFGGGGREAGAGIAKVPLYVPQHVSAPSCIS